VEQAFAQRKSYGKWGGFVDGFAEFDALFFNMSPREAASVDPQERLFMQSCWEVLEDAGYTRDTISSRHGGRVGVFVGITRTGFELYSQALADRGEPGIQPTSFCSAANRVSYFLNLRGPSMPIDTMCSSSLTAIHEACEHLLRDECELAIAGGVNLLLHPSNYILLSTARMLSTSGRCRSFGAGGDGYSPGEAVGTVLLKRLSAAVSDRDHIYGVIRSSSINHGGKTNGYTVPNPAAQAELIQAALTKAGVNARTISYIEAHGTGTELGDPIEIAGLTEAFERDTADRGFCAIGSVKSNIGHAEAAAGIAALTKVLLQLRHQQLAPSLHADTLNSHIDFASKAFKVQRELAPWQRPTVTIDGETREYPRIAGISSFGAGGANAHLVIEEYVAPQSAARASTAAETGPFIIVLSAKDEDRLRARVADLRLAIAESSDADLPNIAYTLQVGREAMEHRIAFPVSSVVQLRETLERYLSGDTTIPDFHRGEVKRNREAPAQADANPLEQWVRGMPVDWHSLYAQGAPQRIPLPPYPFAREKLWTPGRLMNELETAAAQTPGADELEAEFLSELLDELIHESVTVDAAISRARAAAEHV
jgi:acyl transferase domain-containing protein